MDTTETTSIKGRLEALEAGISGAAYGLGTGATTACLFRITAPKNGLLSAVGALAKRAFVGGVTGSIICCLGAYYLTRHKQAESVDVGRY